VRREARPALPSFVLFAQLLPIMRGEKSRFESKTTSVARRIWNSLHFDDQVGSCNSDHSKSLISLITDSSDVFTQHLAATADTRLRHRLVAHTSGSFFEL
jgi:hypothetical protein